MLLVIGPDASARHAARRVCIVRKGGLVEGGGWWSVLVFGGVLAVWKTAARHDALYREANEDRLTGLLNRRGLEAELAKALGERNDGPLRPAVVYLDLDGFKDVNDRYGHEAGDQVLTTVGRRLASTVRPGDAVSRLGGDEFVIVFRRMTSDAEVATVIDRLRTVVAAPVDLGSVEVRVGASLGAALAPADGPADLWALLESADAAMFAEKSGGQRTCRDLKAGRRAAPARKVDLTRDWPSMAGLDGNGRFDAAGAGFQDERRTPMTEVRFCPTCGAARMEGARFCGSCGADLETVATGQQANLASAPDAPPVQLATVGTRVDPPGPFLSPAGSASVGPAVGRANDLQRSATATEVPAPARRRRYRPALLLFVGVLVVLVAGGVAAAAVGALPWMAKQGGRFVMAGTMSPAVYGATATLLPDGRVLFAGGDAPAQGGQSVTPSAVAELYDAGTGSFTLAGSMTTPRDGAVAVRLADGRVLVLGGTSGNEADIPEPEIYDPRTGSFTGDGALASPRWSPTATLLPDGLVLVAGGNGYQGVLSSAELFDPQRGTTVAVVQMTAPRWGQTATLLMDGSVLLTGGQPTTEASPLSSAELFDPRTRSFTPVSPMSIPRVAHTATLLPDGRVLMAGGAGPGDLPSTVEVFDPATRSFHAAGSLLVPRFHHAAVLLRDGRVLIVGGIGVGGTGRSTPTSAEVFDPRSGTSALTGRLAVGRPQDPTLTVLADGRVLVAGGTESTGLVEIYQP
jgi:diguanylate cyclase (GGDEF)-like protein